MRYSLIRKTDISNGEGIGVALFVQGCHFHCRGCFNQETWDFSGGMDWTPQVEDKFFKLVDRQYIVRISILGGEPLAEENMSDVLELVIKLKRAFPNKQIWLYSGYTYEDVLFDIGSARRAILEYIDVMIDGQFVLAKQDLANKSVKWAGSENQRVIDVQASLSSRHVVPYVSNYNS